MALDITRQRNDFLLLAWLFLWELCIAAIAMALYMKGERSFTAFLLSKPGMMLLGATVGFVIGGTGISSQYLAYKRASSPHFSLIVTMNLITIMLMLLTGEVLTRTLSRSSIEGDILGRRTLIPKSWNTLAHHNQRVLNEARSRPTFYVYDSLLGWTLGRNRRSVNGLYYSSFEGMRAPHEGVTFSKTSQKRRIALVGDSYTFGEDVAYEDSWGYRLEKALGPEFEVLNFGVPGYGVDQAYLRYEKDVREWKPKIVILSFIGHDTERTMTVYTPLNYPDWDMPFSKPRFILRDGDLRKINVPPIEPEAIFSRRSISELPFLEYDRGYKKREWQTSFPHHSYLARAFMTWFPRPETILHDVSDDALISVNASILKAFVASADQIGAAPIVLYHPKRAFESNSSLSKRVLQEAGVSYTEPTPCLQKLDASEWFFTPPAGVHYTPRGNAAVAKCLVDTVRQALAQSSLS